MFAISERNEFKNAAYADFAAAYTDWPGAGTLLATLHTPTIFGAIEPAFRRRAAATIRFATSFVREIAPIAFN